MCVYLSTKNVKHWPQAHHISPSVYSNQEKAYLLGRRRRMYVYVPAYGLEKAYVCKCVYGPYMEGPNKAYVYEPQKAYTYPRRPMWAPGGLCMYVCMYMSPHMGPKRLMYI